MSGYEARNFNYPAFDASSYGYGRDFQVPAAIQSNLYALYVPTNKWKWDPLHDYSGNGRDLTNAGVTFADDFPIFSNSAYLSTPFTGATFYGVGGNKGTLLAISKTVPSQALTPIVGNHQSGQSSGLAVAPTGLASYYINASTAASTATDAGATDWRMIAGMGMSATSQQAYSKRAGQASAVSSVLTPGATTWGTAAMRIGSAVSGITGAGAQIALVAFFTDVKSQAQLDTIYAALVDPLSDLGITL